MRIVTYYQNANIDGTEYHWLTYDEFASLVIEDNEDAIELIGAAGNSLGIFTRHDLEMEGLLG